MVQQGFFLDDDEEMAPQEPANQKYSLRKQIVPYICSTQEDFNEEKDFLQKNIFPQIDQICRKRGASFSPVDIRWTDTDDSVTNGHLLKLNLDYICKCSPFFICLLGETYGPYRPVDSPSFPRRIPKSPEDIDEVESWIDRNYFIAASAGYNWILKEAHQNNSIPELEIIQAAFFNDNKHCHFYFRQPEHLDHKYGHLPKDERECLSVVHKPDSEYADLNIRDLKQRIVKKGLPVKYFQTFEELGNHVLKDWLAIIETLYPPLTFDSKILGSEEYQEWIANETFADFRRQLFIKSPECNSLMNEITDFANSISEDTFLEEEEQLSIYRSYSVTSSLRKKKQAEAKYKSMLLLQGDRGCGKSTLIANWLHRFMIDFPNVKVIYQYIGSSAKSRDIAIFMRRCIEELRTEYLRPDSEIDGPTLLDDDVPWTFHDVAQAFVAALSLGPCVLVMDGLDEITSSLGITSREIKNFSWLPFPLPSQCRLICTTCRSDLSYFSLSKRTDVRLHAIPLFDSMKIRLNFLEDSMQQYYDHLKHLPGYEKQISDIKLTTRPLFLSTLGTEMQTFEIYTNLEKYLDDTYDHCSSFRDLCVRCFNRWTREHSWQKECLFLDSTDEEPELEFEGWVPDVLRLLAVAKTGLTQTDLFGLLEQLGYTGRKVLTTFKWLQFKSCIGNLIYEKPDGLIQFSHHHIQETVEYILLRGTKKSKSKQLRRNRMMYTSLSNTLKPGATDVMTRTDPEKAWKEQKKKYHSHMAKYFMQQPFSQRIMEELPWQLMMAGDVDSLVRVLTDPIVIEKMLDNKKLNPSNKLELAYYWSLLRNLDVSAATEYQKLLMKMGVINTIYPDEKPTHSEEPYTDRDSVVDDLPLSIITETDGKCTPPLFTPVSIPTIISPPPTDREQLSVIEESMSTNDSDADYKAQIKKEMDRKFESTPKTSSVKGEVIDTIFLTEAKAKQDAKETEHEDKDGTKGGNLSYITKLTWLITDLLKDLGYIYVTERILLALNNKLDKSYPLSIETQLIHAKIQERLGTYETDKQRSERWYRKSLRTVMNLSDIEEDDPFYMDVQNIKGRLLCSFGYIRLMEDLFDTADDLLQEGLDCSQECGNLPLKATTLFNIGLLRAKQEDFLLSETNLRQALNMRELWYGKSHPLVSEVLFVLAGIMGNPRNRKGFNNLAAESLYRRTVKIQEECRGKDDITVANTLFELGKLLQDETSFQAKCEAVRLLRRALDIKTSKLGGDHIDTRAVRQYLNNLEVTIKMGRYEFGPAKPTDTRSQDRPYSSLSWREKDLKNFERKAKRAYLQSQAGSRPTSKEDYRSFSRGSNLTFLSASEKLMMESDRPRLLHRESIDRRLQSSTPRTVTDISETTEPKKQVTLEIHVNGLEEEEETADKVPETRVADPQIDSFGDDLIPQTGGTFITSSKTVRTSPDANTEERGPSKLYKRFGSAGSDRSGSVCSKHGDSKLKSNRNLYSARSGSSFITAVSSVSKTSIKSHSSSCDIPGPHSLHISNARSVTSGPNCTLSSLLGPSETPRNISKGIHHNSAWYHVPGRYSTPDKKVPPKRSQKTKESVALQRKYGYQPKTYGKPSTTNSSKYSYGRISFSKKGAREEQNIEQEAEFGPMVKGYQMPSTNGYTDFDYAQHEGEFETALDPVHHSSTVKFKEAVIVD